MPTGRDVPDQRTARGQVSALVDSMPPSAAKPLTRDDRGVWSGTLGPLAPDLYFASYVVDGTPRQAGYLHIRGASPEAWETRKVPHGAIHQHWYDSKSLSMLRSVFVYTPPGYERDTTSYPVLYLLHGSGGTESSWIRRRAGQRDPRQPHCRRSREADDRRHAVRPSRAVDAAGPHADVQGPRHPGVCDDLIDDVMPLVEQTYRAARQADRAPSPGCRWAATRRARSASRASTCSATSRRSAARSACGAAPCRPRPSKRRSPMRSPIRPRRTARCASSGPRSARMKPTCSAQHRVFNDVLDRHGIRYEFVTIPGGHTWHVWRRNLRDVVPRLFQR